MTKPEEYSIQYWLKAINRSLEKLIVESLDRFTASHREKPRDPPIWKMRMELQEAIADSIAETTDLAAFLTELMDAGVVEAWIRGMLGAEAPAVDEIHYADGRIRPLSDLISGVEATIEHRGTMVGGVWIPERPETTD